MTSGTGSTEAANLLQNQKRNVSFYYSFKACVIVNSGLCDQLIESLAKFAKKSLPAAYHQVQPF